MSKSMHRKRDQFYSRDFEFIIDRRNISFEYSRDPIHWHDYCEMEFVCSGNGVHLLNNHHLELHPGSVYIVTPTDFHRVYANEGQSLDLYHMQFGCTVLNSTLMQRITQIQSSLPGGISAQLSGPSLQTVQDGFDQLLKEFSLYYKDSTMMMRTCLERMCLLILREVESGLSPMEQPIRSEVNTPIHKAIQYVRYNFRNPITLADLANHVHLSNNYFGEMFRESMGMSFSEYLRQCRLAYAYRLLIETELNISEVAYESGFSTSSYFSDIFRQQYNMTPTDFRRKQTKKRRLRNEEHDDDRKCTY